MRILYWSQDICDIIDTFREPVRFTSYYLTISLLVKRESRDSNKDTKRKRWKCVWNLVKPKSVLPICDLPCPALIYTVAGLGSVFPTAMFRVHWDWFLWGLCPFR